MSTAKDFYQQLVFAAIAVALVGIFACFSGILAVDGRFTQWNRANYCAQAYGDANALQKQDCPQ